MSFQFEELCRKLNYRLSLPLPGIQAQLKMAHLERRLNYSQRSIPEYARMGAVLILLYEEDDHLKTCFIERTTYDGVHSGQIAFPGGKKEQDETLAEAALREAEEEVGVKTSDVMVLGQLTELYIPPSNFLVHPFVGAITYKPDFFPEPAEVAEVVEVNVDDLSDSRFRGEKKITLSNGTTVETPYFNLQGKTVWGATAMIISEFLEVLASL
jgi:8-oxo-dGTP pyrophosphatase MutT (NUDIX family)